MIIEIRAGKCENCGDTIYSRTQHDCMHCTCGATFIDGGSAIVNDEDSYGYIRIKGTLTPTTVKLHNFLSIEEAKKGLYDDWNNRINKYGRVHG